MTERDNFDLFAVLYALAGLQGSEGYAYARATTMSGSTYVVEMTPSRTHVHFQSRAIGSRSINVTGAYVHGRRLHVNGVDPMDSLVTSQVVDLEVRSGRITYTGPTAQQEMVEVIAGAFGARR